MNRKKIIQLLLATSTIAYTIGLTGEYVKAVEQVNVLASQDVAVKYHNIMGKPEATKSQLVKYFNSLNINNYKLPVSIDEFVNIAYEEANEEGVRGDIVVAQAFLETGYFTYGNGSGIVQPDDNNFAGIGAIGTSGVRNTFNTVRDGLRAQVQHLKAYASTDPLNNAKIDPRFQYVARGSAKTIEELGGRWAYPGYDTKAFGSFEQALVAGSTYGQSIYSIIERAEATTGSGNVVNTSTGTSATSSKGQVINVSTNLRMRQSPSLNSTVIAYLNNGQAFDIKGKSADWYYISLNGKLGYIHKDYVKEINDAPTTIIVPVPTANSGNTASSADVKNISTSSTQLMVQVINVTTNLRIRQAASTSSNIVGYLNPGQTVNIKDKSGDWYHIEANGKSGYIYKDYVKEINGASDNNQSTGNNQGSSGSNNNSSTSQPSSPTNTNASSSNSTKPSKGQVINISTSLRIRQSASTSSSIIGYLSNGQTFDIKDVNGDWYYIQAGGKVGYISSQYVKIIGTSSSTAPTTGGSQTPPAQQTSPAQTSPTPTTNNQTGMVVNVSTNLRMRSKPSTDSSSYAVAYLLPNQTFKILGSSGDWFNISVSGKTGYVSKAYVKIVDGTSNAGTETASKSFSQMYDILKSQIGAPYVYGGYGQEITSTLIDALKKAFPTQATNGMYDNISADYINKGYKAFDCSGLMQWGYKQIGVNIGRTTYDQIDDGQEVSIDQVKPGDLLFYTDISHVGMYVGDGKWIEAPNSKNFVRVTDVPWSKIGKVRRILN